MKKLLILLLAAPLLFAACSDDDLDFITNPPVAGEDYADTNTRIENGRIVGEMSFRGSYDVSDKNGMAYNNPMAEFAVKPSGEGLAVYMNGVKFAQAMPALDIRMTDIEYMGEGLRVEFAAGKIIPDAFIKAAGWQPFDKYPMTEVRGSIDGITLRIEMKCMGVYTILYAGKLLK